MHAYVWECYGWEEDRPASPALSVIPSFSTLRSNYSQQLTGNILLPSPCTGSLLNPEGLPFFVLYHPVLVQLTQL